MQSSQKLKPKVLQTIDILNVSILKDFIQLKQTFEASHISNNEITNKLKEWKPKFEQTVNNCMRQLLGETGFEGTPSDFVSLVKELSKIYGSDQQYIEKVKCLNSTTEMIKEYIRIKAIKDPTTAVIEMQPIQNEINFNL